MARHAHHPLVSLEPPALGRRSAPRNAPVFMGTCGRIATVKLRVHLKKYCFTTCHLPHGEKPDADYVATLVLLETIVKESRQQRRSCIIGVDANATVGAQDPHDDKSIIGTWGYGVRNERGRAFVSWLHTVRLCATNTMFRKCPVFQWTHQLWSTGTLRQIDFVLVEKRVRRHLADAYAKDDLAGASDHRAALAVLHIDRAVRNKRKGNTSRTHETSILKHSTASSSPACKSKDR